MKLLIWSAFALLALLWTAGAAAVAGLLQWGVGLLRAGDPVDLARAVTAMPIPAWWTEWVDIGVIHAAFDMAARTLDSLQQAWPWFGSMLGWLVPLTWAFWGLGLALLLALAAGAHLLVRRARPPELRAA